MLRGGRGRARLSMRLSFCGGDDGAWTGTLPIRMLSESFTSHNLLADTAAATVLKNNEMETWHARCLLAGDCGLEGPVRHECSCVCSRRGAVANCGHSARLSVFRLSARDKPVVGR